MVTDIHDAELDKPHRKTFQRLDDPPEYSKNFSWNVQNNCLTKNQNSMPENSQINNVKLIFNWPKLFWKN